MDDSDENRSAAGVLLTVAAGLVAAGVRVLQGAPGLNVALWAVLAPILVATVLALVARARRQLPSPRRQRAEVVLPDPRHEVARLDGPAPRPPRL